MTQNFLDFINTVSNDDLIHFLFEKRLIKDNSNCAYCNFQMVLKATKGNKFGFIWRCMNFKCDKYLTTSSIFRESFFEKFKMDIRKILTIIFYLCKNLLVVQISDILCSKEETISFVKNKIYEKIRLYWENNPIKLGGFGRDVQIDETKLNYNVKSHRGRGPATSIWAITIADISSTPATGYAEIVDNRSAMTLIPIIERVVRSGSRIITDEWPAYSSLSRHPSFSHLTVCHKYNFVDPETSVHTQHVESFNNKLKSEIKKRKGLMSSKRKEFIDFFLFLDHFKKEAFKKLIEIIKHE